MAELGTRAQFNAWLTSKGFTYTRYAKLPTETKLDMYKEYRKAKKR